MDDVEVLAVEQRADPADQVKGEGDSRHRPVAPHRHAATDADETGMPWSSGTRDEGARTVTS